MKIAIIGYGKMGKAIEQIIQQQGKHQIVLKITSQNLHELMIENLQQADVAIEFSNPESVINNLLICLKANLPVVCGSTGWVNELPKIETEFATQNGALVYASNFSVGVNLFFAITNYASKLMSKYDSYNTLITETHHTEKKDSPSGTAISLQKIVQPHYPNSTIPIDAFRIDGVVGTHQIIYKNAIDEITLEHKAHSRSGFAQGAVMAAEWIADKKGVYEFKQILGID